MKKEVAAMTAIISILMLSSFLSNLDFSNTGFKGLIGESVFQKKQNTEIKSVRISQDEANLANNSNPPCVPLFVVTGLDEEHYRLRTGVSSKYEDGRWVMDSLDYRDAMEFSSGKIFSVTPLVSLEGNLPVVKDTVAISVPAGFNSSAGLFRVKVWNESYYGVYVSRKMTSFESGDVRPVQLDIDGWKMERVRELAMKITENASSDYEKLVMIERYLQSHYEYSPDYNRSADLIYDFLFVEKKGICTHFASSFIALATSLDIPVRAVFGYLAKPTSSSQVVYSCQAHMWVEAKLGEEWVEFDPTPPARSKISTVTEITGWDREIVEGSNITVTGRVILENGRAVENGFVEVYLKESKDSPKGKLLGIARIDDGVFKLTAKINESGTYSIVAHYTGSLLYDESWSDPEVKVYSLPEIVANIPDVVPENFTLTGKIVDDGSGVGNKSVIVEVDGKRIYARTDSDGKFSVKLLLPAGEHTIRVISPKEGLYAERIIEKSVTAGTFQLRLLNSTLAAGERNAVRLEIMFNGLPYSGDVVINGMGVRAENGIAEFTIKPERAGDVRITVSIGGFRETLAAKAKLGVEITAEYSDGWLEIRVTDSAGNAVSGTVYVNGEPVTLESGIGRIRVSGSEFRIVYPGDELHFPAEAVYKPEKPWYLLVIPILAALGIVVYRNTPRIAVELDKEYRDMPNIWKVGEEINIRVKSSMPYVISANGKISSGDVIFDRPGEFEIRVKAIKNGKVKKEKVIGVKIVEDYGEAVEAVFKMFEKEVMKRKGIDCRTMTARELMNTLNLRSGDLLRLFELYEYAGKKGYGRKEFVKAFEIYSRLRREI